MERTFFPRWAGVIAASIIVLTFGFSTPARAQDPPDFNGFTNCVVPAPDTFNSLGFCSPIWNLGLSTLEVGFGAGLFDSTISYNGTILTIKGGMSAVYFDNHGNKDQFDQDYARMATTRVVISVKVGNDGKFAGSGGNACEDGGFDDFCVKGIVTDSHGVTFGTTAPLLRGIAKYGTNKPNAIMHGGILLDVFEYYIQITGGDLFLPYMWNTNGFNKMLVESFGYNPPVGSFGHVNYDANGNPFGPANPAGFTEYYMSGLGALVANEVGAILDPDPCNGRISGAVTDYFNALAGIPGASVELNGVSPLTVHTVLDPADTNGAYASLSNLCVGSYQVTGHAPAGYTVYTTAPYANTFTVNVSTDSTRNNSNVSGVNFKMYSSPVNTSAFTTFAQAGWGTKPKGQNAGALLATYFDFLYPTGELEIGIIDPAPGYSITETGAAAILDFLPQEGKPMPLTADYVDPPSRFKIKHAKKFGHHRRLGSLAGETLALELNVRFSAFSLTRSGLGALKLASGPLKGKTVNDVLGYANLMLGGGLQPAAIGLKNYDALEDIVELINKNYQAGTVDRKYLVP